MSNSVKLTYKNEEFVFPIIEGSENAAKAVLYLDDEKKHRKVVSSMDKNFINLLMEEEWVGKILKFKDGQAIP